MTESGAVAPARARTIPVQKRSRERFERILETAGALLSEVGSEAFRMSDVVERSGVPFGSLYQYFPDKTAIIGTLADRYNAVGRICVAQELDIVMRAEELHPALCGVVDGYYRMFVENPVMRDIWHATQADRALQQIDEEDGAFLSGLLLQALLRIAPERDPDALAGFAMLTMTLIAAAVRHAIALERREGQKLLALFKAMLPRDLSALEPG